MPSWRIVFINKRLGTKFTCIVKVEPGATTEQLANAGVSQLLEHLRKQGVGSLSNYRVFSIRELSEMEGSSDASS